MFFRGSFMKKILLTIAILITILLIIFFFIKNAEPQLYNVLFIAADSFRPDHLNCYGYTKRVTSPTIDTLAKNGVLFYNLINPSGWTNQSLVSIFSSLESPVHKVVTRDISISQDWYLPLEILRDYGYLIPKLQGWQINENHSNLGFDDFITDSAPWDWLEAHRNERFFIWYQFLHPHLPYNATDTYIKMFLDDSMYKNDESKERIYKSVFTNYMIKKGSVEFKPEDKEIIEALYDAEIRYLDDDIKRLLDMLDKYNLRDKTIIIIGADHGEELLDHNFIGHASTSSAGTLYDEIIHTPFIISFPKELPVDKKILLQVRGIDIMPTILDIMNIEIPEYLQGKSLLPMIQGLETEDRIAFSETSRYGYSEPDPKNVTDYIRSVRTSEWKLIHYQYKEDVTRFELFNLKDDPDELINVIDTYPEIAKEYKTKLFNWLLCCEQSVPQGKSIKQKGLIAKIKGLFEKEELDLTNVPEPPELIFPKNGDILSYENLQGRVDITWTGKDAIPYVIEYKVGDGLYYLDGTMKVKGNKKSFGPFSKNYWETFLVIRNPYKMRVAIDKEPRKFSEWVEIKLK
ncbi:MAG: sulfatase [Candidatus Hydrogenedentota bacterium]